MVRLSDSAINGRVALLRGRLRLCLAFLFGLCVLLTAIG